MTGPGAPLLQGVVVGRAHWAQGAGGHGKEGKEPFREETEPFLLPADVALCPTVNLNSVIPEAPSFQSQSSDAGRSPNQDSACPAALGPASRQPGPWEGPASSCKALSFLEWPPWSQRLVLLGIYVLVPKVTTNGFQLWA